MNELSGKVAVVTGGSRGIGAASARLLGEAGADLVLLGRTESPTLMGVAERIQGPGTVLAWGCDSTQSHEIAETYRRVRSEFGRLDILVNNAGILRDALIGMISDELIEETLAVNTVGPILHMQAASRLMRKSGGSIVNLSSIIGRVGNVGQVAYAASKAAVLGMTLSAAKELAPRNIRVNAVAPGFIETDMTNELPVETHQERVASIKMGRVGTPEDVAGVVLFLASEQSRYVTGQVIGVDGGMLI